MPSHYLTFAVEVFITTLGLLIALIYFYIQSDRKWQRLVHDIQDEILAFRKKYLDEKERADTVRELLYDKNIALEKAYAELAEVKKNGNAYLIEIAKLKEEIEELHQSEKLRSEIVNQLITSKIQNERLTTELEANQKATDKLNEAINNLGGCPRIEKPTTEKPFRPDFPIKFVKYAQYSPHLIKKSDSKWLSLATVSILGQPPRTRD